MIYPLPKLFTAATTALLLASATPGFAQDDADLAKIDILPGWQMSNGHRMAAIRIRLEPGWHTYWRAPGEAGIPPSFDFAGSQNLAGIALHWPAPDLFAQNDMWYLGFEHELILPVELIPTQAGDITLKGTMSLGVCQDICMPLQAQLQMQLPEGATGPMTTEIKAALADQPKQIRNAACDAAPLSDGMRLTATLTVPDLGPEEVAVIEHPDRDIWVSEATVTRNGRQIQVESDLVPANAQPFAIDRSDLTITVIGGGQAYEARGCSAG
ncbi:protein-disulfide reductase DsbD domain-containing protein [Celeribacter neptunius]|uniref:Thiol-disulfide interchange protein, contains DsbC and DsbD domains n=1 Tax=Celeribacter neptunius TaxID=588602 RepID=A0A1I3UJC0_9RHOB|nr:protein-disulfide reductase DsbD domain-containing protein [Celeribacter neptunius]SFJ83140.1 Thiol-disulfide interchange protein, contains DsbC and DsbD domains [Celeribacter neptunius]